MIREGARDRFSDAIASLPNYKRRDAWAYIAELEKELESKDRQINELADEVAKQYGQGEIAGLSRARSKPGDGDMGG